MNNELYVVGVRPRASTGDNMQFLMRQPSRAGRRGEPTPAFS